MSDSEECSSDDLDSTQLSPSPLERTISAIFTPSIQSTQVTFINRPSLRTARVVTDSFLELGGRQDAIIPKVFPNF